MRLTATKFISVTSHPRWNVSKCFPPYFLFKEKKPKRVQYRRALYSEVLRRTSPRYKDPLVHHKSIVGSSEAENYIILIQELKKQKTLSQKNVADLTKTLADEAYDAMYYFCKNYHDDEMIVCWMYWSVWPRKQISLIVLRSILFLRFRMTVREVMKPLLSEKVPQLDEGKFKGANLLANKENIDRDVDYTFFLRQLKKDIKSGHLTSFFLENNKFPRRKEFYEVCEYALQVDKELFLKSRPTDTYYMEEEIMPLIRCDVVFPDAFDQKAVVKAIGKINPNPKDYVYYDHDGLNKWCPAAEMKCLKVASYLVILLSIK